MRAEEGFVSIGGEAGSGAGRHSAPFPQFVVGNVKWCLLEVI